jgi:hypothetical protein
MDYSFEWDERKNRRNVEKHGFDFADAEEMFRGALLVDSDAREDYGEERWVGIGMTGGRVAHVVFAMPSPKVIRIISLRKATRYESRQYQTTISDKLEED